MKRLLLIGLAAVNLAADAAPGVTTPEKVLAYASAPYNAIEQEKVELGLLNGTRVVVDFICADVCPDYAVRVIHYDLKKDQTCSAVGGVEKALRVPVGIGATDRIFCFPKILVDNWKAYQRKMSSVPAGVGPHE
jgi:hypothetical protein